jgi:ABC-type Fe3+-hydroxamate transport system substrate-binding protein
MWRQLVDDLDRPLALAHPPQRIVSLVPSLTELVCALGRADRLAGVTRYCTDPPAVVASLPKLGGTKNPDIERLVELGPDLVLVNAEENRREDYEALTAAGLTVFVSFPRTLEATGPAVARVGEAIDAAAAAHAILQDLAVQLAQPPLRQRRVFCPIWRKPWMSFNRDTYADALLRRAGGENVCAAAALRYPVVDLEQVAAADPQVILLPDEPYPFAKRHIQALSPLCATTAWRDGRIHFIDGKALSWYGHRTAPALREFRSLLAA